MNTKRILGWLSMKVNNKISHLTADISRYTNEMNSNYEYFFGWYAADLLKSRYYLGFWRRLYDKVMLSDLEGAENIINATRENIKSDFLSGMLTNHSSEQMMNIQHQIMLEAKQALYKELDLIAMEIECSKAEEAEESK